MDATLDAKRHMVIVVAEGAGQRHVATGKKDSSGHTIYGDIGVYLRDMLNAHLKPKGGRTFYIDPSYIIRSVVPRRLADVHATPPSIIPKTPKIATPNLALNPARSRSSWSGLGPDRALSWPL